MTVLHKLFSPEEVAPPVPDALPAGYLPTEFIQDTANELRHDVLRVVFHRLGEWLDAAIRGKQRDPAFVVILMRETAQKLFKFANIIEDEIKKVPSRQ